MSVRHPSIALVVLLCASAVAIQPARSLHAQETQGPRVEGTLIDRVNREPIGGALVTLVDGGGGEWSSAVTGDGGRFVLAAPEPGGYRIRVERLGYRVWTSSGLTLEAGESRIAAFWVPVEPLPIPGLEVAGTSECPEPAAVRARGYALYQDARAGLQAVVEGETARGYLFAMQLIQEQVDSTAYGRRRRFLLVDTFNVMVPRPIASLTPEELAREGYVRNQPGAVARYYAPLPEVLLSDEFLATHCLGVTEDEDESGIGLTFTPMPGREVPDVAGVLWLDDSGGLRRLEYNYTGLLEFLKRYRMPLLRAAFQAQAHPGEPVGVSLLDIRDEDYGGVLEFEQLEVGAWITRRWEIRMARLGASAWFGGRAIDVFPRAFPLTHTGTVVAVALQPADTASARR